MKKTLGILSLLLVVCTVTYLVNPQFLSSYNLQNTVRWTGLFGILSIGVSFVIIGGGIDLSIGSVVGLSGVLLPWLLVERGWSAVPAVALVLAVSVLIGLGHGLLITRMRLQPFIVTLCGLLLYRGYARYLTDDQTLTFGSQHDTLRELATGRPCSASLLFVLGGVLLSTWMGLQLARSRGRPMSTAVGLAVGLLLLGAGLASMAGGPGTLEEIQVPTPFLLMLGLAVASGLLLRRTVFGRYLFALGRNEQAARYSGIRTHRILVLSYVLCSLLAGMGGMLFALDINSVQPSNHGNFYELYAIAAAVLGGCSLRGGEGSIFGVVIGAAVMRVLYNSINLLRIPTTLEFAIIGAVILCGVTADELVKRWIEARRARRA